MKTLIIVALIVGAGAISRAADPPELRADVKPDVERQLMKVEQDWNEAFKSRDKTALTSFCAEDCQFTDDDGKISDRAHYIEDASKNVKVASYTLSGLVARAYGETGVVTGRWKGTIETSDGNTELTVRFTDTFVRREGRWRAVASQMTRVSAGNP